MATLHWWQRADLSPQLLHLILVPMCFQRLKDARQRLTDAVHPSRLAKCSQAGARLPQRFFHLAGFQKRTAGAQMHIARWLQHAPPPGPFCQFEEYAC